MLDREIGFTGIYPEKAAHKPAEGEARVEHQRTVDQPNHRTDILADLRQHEGCVGKDARVVGRRVGRLPSEIAGLAPAAFFEAGGTVIDSSPMYGSSQD